MNVDAGSGADLVEVGSALLLDGVLSPVSADGGSGSDTLFVTDFLSATPDTNILITGTTITGMGPAPISYAGFEDQFIDTVDNEEAVVNILGTPAGSTTTFDLTFGGVASTVTLGNTDAGFATNTAGTLDGLLGNVTLDRPSAFQSSE